MDKSFLAKQPSLLLAALGFLGLFGDNLDLGLYLGEAIKHYNLARQFIFSHIGTLLGISIDPFIQKSLFFLFIILPTFFFQGERIHKLFIINFLIATLYLNIAIFIMNEFGVFIKEGGIYQFLIIITSAPFILYFFFSIILFSIPHLMYYAAKFYFMFEEFLGDCADNLSEQKPFYILLILPLGYIALIVRLSTFIYIKYPHYAVMLPLKYYRSDFRLILENAVENLPSPIKYYKPGVKVIIYATVIALVFKVFENTFHIS